MRYALMGLLAVGVVGGYGSAIARVAYWKGACHGAAGYHDGRFGEGRFGSRFQDRAEVKQVAAPAQAQPQTVVVQQPAPAPQAAPQIFLIMPGAQAAPSQPQTIVVPAVAVQPQPAPSQVVQTP
jgi:hypothetical protein